MDKFYSSGGTNTHLNWHTDEIHQSPKRFKGERFMGADIYDDLESFDDEIIEVKDEPIEANNDWAESNNGFCATSVEGQDDTSFSLHSDDSAILQYAMTNYCQAEKIKKEITCTNPVMLDSKNLHPPIPEIGCLSHNVHPHHQRHKVGPPPRVTRINDHQQAGPQPGVTHINDHHQQAGPQPGVTRINDHHQQAELPRVTHINDHHQVGPQPRVTHINDHQHQQVGPQPAVTCINDHSKVDLKPKVPFNNYSPDVISTTCIFSDAEISNTIDDSNPTCESSGNNGDDNKLAANTTVKKIPENKNVESKSEKVMLSIGKKVEIADKADPNYKVQQLANNCGIKIGRDLKTKIDGIKKLLYFRGSIHSGRYITMTKFSKHLDLDNCVYKWFMKQRASGVRVLGRELKAAAEKFALYLGFEDFIAHDYWITNFKLNNDITDRKIVNEALSADRKISDNFKHKLKDYLSENMFDLFQVYNTEETRFCWRSFPSNTVADRLEKTLPGHTLSQEKLTAMLCTNADGSHRTRSCVLVGKSNIRSLNVHHKLVYYTSRDARFTRKIFVDWFHNNFCEEVREYQIKYCGVKPSDVKALLLLYNAPAHPDVHTLTSIDGNIICMALPSNTTSLIQPMDQGIIYATKRLYKKCMLNEILGVLHSETENGNLGEDERKHKIYKKIKSYTYKDAICNLAFAWSLVKTGTLREAWTSFLYPSDGEKHLNYGSEDVDDIYGMFREAGEEVDMSDIIAWLECDVEELGYGMMTDEKAAKNPGVAMLTDEKAAKSPGVAMLTDEKAAKNPGVAMLTDEKAAKNPGVAMLTDENIVEASGNLEKENCTNKIINYSSYLEKVDDLINLTSETDNVDLAGLYQYLWQAREIILEEVNTSLKNAKIKHTNI